MSLLKKHFAVATAASSASYCRGDNKYACAITAEGEYQNFQARFKPM